jgi:hypothetical protein
VVLPVFVVSAMQNVTLGNGGIAGLVNPITAKSVLRSHSSQA